MHPLEDTLQRFVFEECQPAEVEYDAHLSSLSGNDRWSKQAIPPCIHRLQKRAKELGLWNLFLTNASQKMLHASSSICSKDLIPRCAISNTDYAVLCEILGHSFIAAEACNSSAPDTGNMEVLIHYGTPQQQAQYLIPLLKGQIRSAFLMTEPDVASSDATNICTQLTKFIHTDGSIQYRLNGKKWWSTGAMDPRCQIALVLAKMDYSHPSLSSSAHIPSFSNTPHQQHTLVLVPMQHISRVRPLQVFGYDDAPHGHAECLLQDIMLDETSIILGEGRGFEIAQGRLGPGRIHHCMRSIGIASRCYQLMMSRLLSGRQTFGLSLDQHGVCMEQVADSYQDLLSARLLTLHCARQMDQVGSLVARKEIALIKVAVPQLTFQVVDRAIQIHGAAGLCQDTILAKAYCALRSLRIADGPDAVHKRTVALMEISKWKKKLQMEMNKNKDEEENKKKEERRRIKSTSPRTNSRL